MFKPYLLGLMFFLSFVSFGAQAKAYPAGQVDALVLPSKALASNLLGYSPKRQIRVYLPAGYHSSKRRYPVVYYIPQGEQMLEDTAVTELFDQAIGSEHIGAFILVTGDFGIPEAGNFFGNNPTFGRWLDHISDELVPFIDKRYRTLAASESRGIAGHFLGGYAAMKSAILHPEVFGSVYALHPVGTMVGDTTALHKADWREIHEAKTKADLHGYSGPFVAMAQAHLPNPERPPFYADYMVELVEGELIPNPQNISKLFNSFHLRQSVVDYSQNLHKLRGIKFDWGRNDGNADHVYGNRKLTVLLADYGVAHEALEHNGNGWDYGFDKQGRIYNDLLPFFNQHLQF